MARMTARGRKVGGSARSFIIGGCRPKPSLKQRLANQARFESRLLEAVARFEKAMWEKEAQLASEGVDRGSSSCHIEEVKEIKGVPS